MIRPREELRYGSTGTSYQRDEDWTAQINCIGVDPEAFFVEGQGSVPSRTVIDVCLRCPVIQSCLDKALSVPERYGFFGGATAEERAAMARGERPATPPILDERRCGCGSLLSPRRKQCGSCDDGQARERDAKRRAANQERVAS